MNPNGLVPTIEDDGFVLWESNSCVRYIAAKFSAGRLWPTDLRQRADAERWMGWQLTTLSAPGWTIFLGLVLTKPEQRDITAIAAATKRFNELWKIVNKVLATHKFVAGDHRRHPNRHRRLSLVHHPGRARPPSKFRGLVRPADRARRRQEERHDPLL
jgi:glutathione S-transferase